MRFDDAIDSVAAVYADRPAAVLPVFLLGAGVTVAAQSVPVLGAVLVYAHLLGSGRLQAVADAATDADFDSLGENPEQAANEAALEALADAVAGLFTPTVVAVLLLAALGGVVAYVLARAVVRGAQAHAAAAMFEGDDDGVRAGVVGGTRDARSFLAFEAVRGVLLLAPTVVVLALGPLAAATGGGGALALLGLGALAWAPLTLAAYVAFMFVPQAMAVDGVGFVGGVRRNWAYVRDHPRRAAGYVGLVVVGTVALGVLGVVLQTLGVSAVFGLLTWVVVVPALALLKTGLYVDGPPVGRRVAGSGAPSAVRRAFARGVGSLGAFVRRNAALVGAVFVLFCLGVVGGWVGTSRFALDGLGQVGRADVFGSFPVAAFVNIAANNWLVAIGTSYAGLAFGGPTVVTIAFNGLIVGAVGGVIGDPVVVAAFILPHGVIEVPALAVAGALGLDLGRTAWNYRRGRVPAGAVADAIVRAYYVLLGLLPAFLVAALVEAFLTPAVATYFI